MRISDWISDVCSSDLDPAVKYAPACDTLKAPLGRRASSAIEKMQPERASVTIDVDISNRPRDWAPLPLSVLAGTVIGCWIGAFAGCARQPDRAREFMERQIGRAHV